MLFARPHPAIDGRVNLAIFESASKRRITERVDNLCALKAKAGEVKGRLIQRIIARARGSGGNSVALVLDSRREVGRSKLVHFIPQ
jgi:hypothetical protein